MRKNLNNQHGFTLVELMIVVAIIGILAAIAIPQYLSYIEQSKIKTCASNFQIASSFAAAEVKKDPAQRTDDLLAELNRGGKRDPYNASRPAFGSQVYSYQQGNCQIGVVADNNNLTQIDIGDRISISGPVQGDATAGSGNTVDYNIDVE